MNDALIYQLAEIASMAQQQFQNAYKDIDPILGINRKLREKGFAVDILTIDCKTHKKRVTLLIEDAKPTSAGYQFGNTDQDPQPHFESIDIKDLTQQGFYDLMCRGLAV